MEKMMKKAEKQRKKQLKELEKQQKKHSKTVIHGYGTPAQYYLPNPGIPAVPQSAPPVYAVTAPSYTGYVAQPGYVCYPGASTGIPGQPVHVRMQGQTGLGGMPMPAPTTGYYQGQPGTYYPQQPSGGAPGWKFH